MKKLFLFILGFVFMLGFKILFFKIEDERIIHDYGHFRIIEQNGEQWIENRDIYGGGKRKILKE